MKYLFAIAFSLTFLSGFSQETFEKGRVRELPPDMAFIEKGHHASLGHGYPNMYKSILRNQVERISSFSGAFGGSGSSYSYQLSGMGPFLARYEYGVAKDIGLGLAFGYYSAGVEQTYSYQYQSGTQTLVYSDITKMLVTSWSLGGRFNYHFFRNESFDSYLGLATGYTNTHYSVSYSSTNPGYLAPNSVSFGGLLPVYFAFTVGVRYYFTENLGIYTELGLDKWSVLQGGLAIKFL